MECSELADLLISTFPQRSFEPCIIHIKFVAVEGDDHLITTAKDQISFRPLLAIFTSTVLLAGLIRYLVLGSQNLNIVKKAPIVPNWILNVELIEFQQDMFPRSSLDCCFLKYPRS